MINVGAERALLASLIQYGSECFVEISDIISEDSFGVVQNQVIFKCVKSVLSEDQHIDLASILSAASKLNLYESVNTAENIQYIKNLTKFFVKKENSYNFALDVKKSEFIRNIKSLVGRINDQIDTVDGTESIDEIISILEDPVNNFIRQEDSGEKPEILGQNIYEYLEYLEENQCDTVGIPTGFKYYDHAIGGGLRRKCVDLIGARAKTGKSVMADCVAINVATNNIPVLMLDTEMDNKDHIHRILANLSGVEINEIAKGKFANDVDKKEKVLAAAKKLEAMPYYYVNVSGKPFDQILNIIKRWTFHTVQTDDNGVTNDCLVIYDYLKLMTSDSISSNIQEYQALGFQITNLHNLCVKLDIPCLSFVQLNRDGINKESADAVSGSDRLIWLCTSFTIFKVKSEEEIAEDGVKNGDRKLVPVASRHGPGLEYKNYINCNMQGAISKISELNTRNELYSSQSNNTGLISQEELDNLNEETN